MWPRRSRESWAKKWSTATTRRWLWTATLWPTCSSGRPERRSTDLRRNIVAKKRAPNKRKITIRDEKHGLPYSKGLMASSIMATGLAPARSYQVAKQIEDQLLGGRKH